MIGKIIDGAKTKEEVEAKLKEAGLVYEDVSEEFGYMNIRVPFTKGYYRIYERDGKIVTQTWRNVNFKYSGIPTFEPSGKRSF